MSAEPTSKIQKITKSIELLLKTVLTGAASKQLQVLLGRRLLARGRQESASSQSEEPDGLVNVPSKTLTAATASSPLSVNGWADRAEGDDSKSTAGDGLSTVLIVEANPLTREVMRRALHGEGYQVLEAENGQSALRIMAHRVPNLVVQNPALPDLEGNGLIQWLRALPGGMAVPVLAMAEDPALLEKIRSSALGFAGYLGKPFLPSRLLQTVCFYVPSRSSRATVPAHLLQRQETGKRGAGEDQVAVSPTRSVAGSLIGQRILIVEDNDAQRQILVARLLELAMDVTMADNGREALEKAKTWQPHAIVCDTLMPGLDGFELCLAIRKHPRLGEIPVILRFAGLVAEVDHELAKEFGATALISRSPDPSELIGALTTCLKDRPAAPPAGAAAWAAGGPKLLPLAGPTPKEGGRRE